MIATLALGGCASGDDSSGGGFAGAMRAFGGAAGLMSQGLYGGQPYNTNQDRPITCNTIGGYTQCR